MLCLSEHGRTPQIDSQAARARAGITGRASTRPCSPAAASRAARSSAATDRIGGDVRDTPVSPKDILATAFHLLGIDPHTTVPDMQGRPYPIAGDGETRAELLG